MNKLVLIALKGVAAQLAVAFLAIQFFPADRTNPPAYSPLLADPAVEQVLRASCFDCHSNETRWPWYSAVAPLSWWITDHVAEGRDVLNFSEWDEDIVIQAVAAGAVADTAEAGDMPLKSYLLTHRRARLTDDEVRLLREWADGLWAEAME